MIEIASEFRLFSLLTENISKKYLIIGCAVFFFACMIIILVALSVTIATHRKFYYAFMPSEDTTSGGGGDGGGGVSPEEEKTTDIPCPLQGAGGDLFLSKHVGSMPRKVVNVNNIPDKTHASKDVLGMS